MTQPQPQQDHPMKASEFCYWLQGYFEMRMVGPPTDQVVTNDQAQMIERHLAMVFKHDLDPQAGSAEHQAELQKIHDGDNPPHEMVMRC